MEPPRQCGGGSDGSARGGDTSNGASLQHWRRPPTTAPRGVGGLSSTTPHGDRSSLHRGVRPAPLSEVAGPQAAVTVGYVAAVAPSLAVVLVSDMTHDDATVQFLLQQSLQARAEEEEQAREEAEVKELEDDVALKEGRLLVLERDRTHAVRITRDTWTSLSSVEQAAVHWFLAKEKVKKRKEKRKKRRRRIRYRTGFLISCSS